MRRRLLLGMVFALLIVPALASAKGPDGVTIDGEGLPVPISVGRQDFDDDVMGLGDAAGFFPAVFAQTPDPMLAAPPTKDLGPKLTLTWHVPSSSTTADVIRQDVYPYAAGGPVTFTEPGQRIFDTGTHGGWFKARSSLTTILTTLGVPDRATLESGLAPAAASPETSNTSPSASPWPVVAIVAAVALGLVRTTTRTVRARRRTRVAPA